VPTAEGQLNSEKSFEALLGSSVFTTRLRVSGRGHERWSDFKPGRGEPPAVRRPEERKNRALPILHKGGDLGRRCQGRFFARGGVSNEQGEKDILRERDLAYKMLKEELFSPERRCTGKKEKMFVEDRIKITKKTPDREGLTGREDAE